MGKLMLGFLIGLAVFGGLRYHVLFYDGDFDVVVVYPKETMTFKDTFVDLSKLEPEDVIERWSVFKALGGAAQELVLALAFGDVEEAEAITVSLEERQFHCRADAAALACWKM